MTSRDDLVAQLAPTAPPCFGARDIWVEYLQSAVEEARGCYHDGPLVFAPGQPVRFDHTYNFCQDCNARHAREMDRRGLCQPEFLVLRAAAALVEKHAAEAAERQAS